MGIDYKKLRIVIAEKKLEWVDIRKALNLTTRTIKNLKDDRYVDMQTLEKICRFLHVDIGDICEIKKDPSN